MLLTSVAFFAAALTLARRRVLVQELPAVEGLARIDVICLDKTGTLTEGDITLDHVEQLNPVMPGVEPALAALAAASDANATLLAIRRAFPAAPGWSTTATVAFSSERKWSAASFAGHGTWVLGAPEMVRPHAAPNDPVSARAALLAGDGFRILLLAHTGAPLAGTALPAGLDAVALVALHETLRPDAAATVEWFDAQGVTVKVISGDNPRTVGAVARRAGVRDATDPVDARELPPGGEALADTVGGHAVFGRVLPEQKRAMVAALQSRGHVVAMTGDGVNDTLALKDADVGVAMGSGAPSTRAVAQVVLLDNRFSVMPGVVAEGRRVIANIERVAALFLTKNVSSLLLSLAVAVAGWPYPFLPRHVTLVSSLAIGIPGFFLALGPNTRRFEGGFVRRVLRFALPAGMVTALAVMLGYALARAQDLTTAQARTAATMVFLMSSLWVLVVQARPLRGWKVGLVAAMGALSALAFAVPLAREFFELHLPSALATGQFVLVGAAAAGAIEAIGRMGPGRTATPDPPPAQAAARTPDACWSVRARRSSAPIARCMVSALRKYSAASPHCPTAAWMRPEVAVDGALAHHAVADDHQPPGVGVQLPAGEGDPAGVAEQGGGLDQIGHHVEPHVLRGAGRQGQGLVEGPHRFVLLAQHGEEQGEVAPPLEVVEAVGPVAAVVEEVEALVRRAPFQGGVEPQGPGPVERPAVAGLGQAGQGVDAGPDRVALPVEEGAHRRPGGLVEPVGRRRDADAGLVQQPEFQQLPDTRRRRLGARPAGPGSWEWEPAPGWEPAPAHAARGREDAALLRSRPPRAGLRSGRGRSRAGSPFASPCWQGRYRRPAPRA